MRILFIVNAEEDTGINVLSNTVAEALERKGIEVDIDAGRGKYDLIHFQNPFPTSFLLTKLRYLRTPMVCTTNMTEYELEGLIPNFLLPVAKLYLTLFYLFCKKIICSSPKIMERVGSKKIFSKKCVFIPNPIDLKLFKRDERRRKEFRKKFGIKKKMLLSVGSIQKRKGIFDFASVANLLPRYQFVWIGKIPEVPSLEKRKELQKLLEDRKSNIIFPGYLGQKGLIDAYSAADLFVFTTYAETFGLVIPEAASTGLPVIARNLPEFRTFDDFILKFSNKGDLEKKIVFLLENKQEYNKYKQLSLLHSKKFDSNIYAKKLLGIYEGILTQ